MVAIWPEVRAQFRLALPVIVIQVGLMAMGFVDCAFMGRVSTADFAAVSLGHAWSFAFIVVGMGVLAALDPLVSQAVGAGDREAIRRALQRGILLAAALTLPVVLCLLPAEPILSRLNQPTEIVPRAAAYSVISALGVLPFLVFYALRQTLQALHMLRPLVICILVTNLLNALLDWVLIFGHLGFEAHGTVGSAWATVLSRWAMAVLVLILAWPVLGSYLRRWDASVLDRGPMLGMLRLGLPVGVQFGIEVGAFHLVALLMGFFGAVELAGHTVAIQLASASFMVPLGISIATSVRVGNAVGRGDQAAVRRSAQVGIAGGALVMAFFALLFFLLPFPLARVFTDRVEVLDLAVLLIPVAGVFQVLDGTQVCATGALRGMADTRVPMWFHIAGFWLVGVTSAWFMAFHTDLGPRGLWWGLVAGLLAVAVMQLLRVRHLVRAGVVRHSLDDEDARTSGEPA